MNAEETAWAAHWEIIRQQALSLPELAVRDVRMSDLAERTGLPWFTRLDNQRVSDYLARDGHAILCLPGFGPTKRAKLLDLIESTLSITPGHGQLPAPRLSPCDRLAEWSVPHAYPTAALLRFSARVLKFCQNDRLECLGDLLKTAESLDERGLLARKNLGRKSVRQLLDLMDALSRGDRQAAARWLPLSENGTGLSLSVAIKQLIADLDSRQRPMLERRLVQGMTLEESARVFQVTRERVRQVAENALLRPLQCLLDAFPDEQNELFQKWTAGASPADHLGAFENPTDSALSDGALRELFSERPEAVAAELDQELQFDQLDEKLRDSLDFHLHDTDLQAFIEQALPVRLHGPFTEYIMGKGGFVINHETGRIGPEKPSLRRLVAALLAAEEEAIPATWLLRLVQQAKAFETLTMEELQGRYRGWTQRYAELTREKVIWSE